ncbi:MAG: hypothetical protein Q9195_000819 [Heterodermia aff. obscurata]
MDPEAWVYYQLACRPPVEDAKVKEQREIHTTAHPRRGPVTAAPKGQTATTNTPDRKGGQCPERKTLFHQAVLGSKAGPAPDNHTRFEKLARGSRKPPILRGKSYRRPANLDQTGGPLKKEQQQPHHVLRGRLGPAATDDLGYHIACLIVEAKKVAKEGALHKTTPSENSPLLKAISRRGWRWRVGEEGGEKVMRADPPMFNGEDRAATKPFVYL